jgi:hypothetical protein
MMILSKFFTIKLIIVLLVLVLCQLTTMINAEIKSVVDDGRQQLPVDDSDTTSGNNNKNYYYSGEIISCGG